MSTYLDTNVFYNAYCPVENNELADWVLNQLKPDLQGITSEWTLIEMFRALKKQVNLGNIEESIAKTVIDFFLSEIGEMVKNEVLKVIPVKSITIMQSRKQVFENNLYAADALHASTAISTKVRSFITFDKDFKGNLETIHILNPMESNFKNNFKTYL